MLTALRLATPDSKTLSLRQCQPRAKSFLVCLFAVAQPRLRRLLPLRILNLSFDNMQIAEVSLNQQARF